MFSIVEVNDQKTEQAFIELPIALYKNNSHWIRPWDHDIKNVFNQAKNPCFKEGGECVRWLLVDNHGKYVGRVAAFINKKTCCF